MEKIRTYDLADLSKATRGFRSVRDAHARKYGRMQTYDELCKGGLNTLQATKISEVADEMHGAHGEWIAKKLTPLIPYLSRGMNSEEDAKLALEKNYKDGLAATVTFVSREGEFDAEDVVASYTVGFATMLRVCERIDRQIDKPMDITPKAALNFAQKSHNIDGRKLAQFLQGLPRLSAATIDRVADSNNPSLALRNYSKLNRVYEELSADERYRDLPMDMFVKAANIRRFEGTLKDFGKGDLVAAQRIEIPKGDGFKVEGVPLLGKRHKNWCGYSSASMLMHQRGYPKSPEELFIYDKGEYDPILETVEPGRGPIADTLALISQELAPALRARVIAGEAAYNKVKESLPELDTPHDVLQYFLARNTPVMVRKPGHFVVITGVNVKRNEYIYNDPSKPDKEQIMDIQNFDDDWKQEDPQYKDIRPSRHLLLVMYPRKKYNK